MKKINFIIGYKEFDSNNILLGSTQNILEISATNRIEFETIVGKSSSKTLTFDSSKTMLILSDVDITGKYDSGDAITLFNGKHSLIENKDGFTSLYLTNSDADNDATVTIILINHD